MGRPMADQKISIAALLSEDLIRTQMAASDKVVMMEDLVQELCAVKAMKDPKGLLEQMLQREKGINTTLDSGLSLPHARIDGLTDIAAILGLLSKPLPDPKWEQSPIRAMFLFFSPNRPEAYSQQLQLLRSIALLFNEAFLDRLLASETPAQALALIRDQEATLARG